MFNEKYQQQPCRYKTLECPDESTNKFDKNKSIQTSTTSKPILRLDVPRITLTNKTIFLGQPFYNTQQIHNMLQNINDQDGFEIESYHKRPFVGMIKPGMQFYSNFECGNLDRVDQIQKDEYNLYMRIDTNSVGHSNWFYFKVSDTQQTKVKFNICNFTKSQSLYTKGMKPYILSKKSQLKDFTQQGENIKYFQQGNSFVLSFTYAFEYPNDSVYFATLPPYTYSQCMNKIKKWNKQYKQYFTKLKIATTLSGLLLPLIVITDKNSEKQKKTIILTARVHPSETCSSFIMQGLIQFLLGDSVMAQYLRKHLIFKIIPMLNPDGVVVGNYRNGLGGVDMNRQFLQQELTLLPEVKALKSLIDDNKERLIGYFDFHGHQVRKNIFLYGPIINSGNADAKIMPLILQERLDSFRFKSCEFGIPKFKLGTARAYANQYIEALCYTFEASFCGYQKGKNIRFSSPDWIQCGSSVGEALFLYLNMKKQNQKYLKQTQLIKQIAEMTAKVESKELRHQSDDELDSQSDAEIFEDYDKEQLNMLQSEMKNQLIQSSTKTYQQYCILKTMKVSSVSRKIKAQPTYLISKKDSRRPSLYPDLSIQNWEFKSKNSKSTENKTSLHQIQKRGRTNSKLLQSFRYESNKKSILKENSPELYNFSSSNNTTLIAKKTIYNFPILDTLQPQISIPLPFIRKFLNNHKKLATQL